MMLQLINTEKIFEGPGNSSLETYVFEISIILIIAFFFGYFFSALIKKSQRKSLERLKKENEELKKKIAVLEKAELKATQND